MTTATSAAVNPKTDLVLERVVDVSPDKVWKAWTTPELLKKWFAPAPWTVSDAKVDLRPGGEFSLTMVSPEGEPMPCTGCILEVVENRRLVWTDTLTEGFRPSTQPFFTGIISIEPSGNGTKYTAHAMHKDQETRDKHAEMGFQEGWGKCLDQLVEMAKSM